MSINYSLTTADFVTVGPTQSQRFCQGDTVGCLPDAGPSVTLQHGGNASQETLSFNPFYVRLQDINVIIKYSFIECKVGVIKSHDMFAELNETIEKVFLGTEVV